MHTRAVDLVFREPDGWSSAIVRFILSVGLLTPALYFVVAFDTLSVLLTLTGVSLVLQGLADVLPSDRRRAAGSLRLAAIGLASSLLVDPAALL